MSVFYIFPSILLSGFMFPFRGMPGLGAGARRGDPGDPLPAGRARRAAEGPGAGRHVARVAGPAGLRLRGDGARHGAVSADAGLILGRPQEVAPVRHPVRHRRRDRRLAGAARSSMPEQPSATARRGSGGAAGGRAAGAGPGRDRQGQRRGGGHPAAERLRCDPADLLRRGRRARSGAAGGRGAAGRPAGDP